MKKILALVDNQGSRFHRLISPLSDLPYDKFRVSLINSDSINENLAKNFDIIMTCWLNKMNLAKLSVLREAYGFQVIQDIDDYWKLPYKHFQKQSVDKALFRVEDQLIFADKVLCSTEFLYDKIKPYNENVFIRRNYVKEDGQFTTELNLVNDRKINIGICGSASHFQDWDSIKGQIDRITSDKEIQDKCNFVIAGYTKSEHWDRMVRMFSYKRNGEVIKPIIINNRSIKDYMTSYSSIDILLAPLENNEFNHGKSELKLLESSRKGCVSISTDLYLQKGYKDYVLVNKDSSYYSNVKKLLNLDYLNSLKIEFQKNLEKINKQQRIDYSLKKFL